MDGQEELSQGLLGHRHSQQQRPGLLRQASARLAGAVGAARHTRRGREGRRGYILDFLALALAAIALSVVARMVGMVSPLGAVATTTTSRVVVSVRMGGDGGGGGSASSGAQPATPGGQCKLDVQQSPLARSCTRLSDVCVDQERIVLYDPAYQVGADGTAPPLPRFEGAPPHHTRSRLTCWRAPDRSWFGEMLPRVEARPASTAEPRRYLQDPSFSSCTVPVLLYGYNLYNFGHSVREFGAQLYSALAETPWAAHARPVLLTPFGTDVPPANRAVLQPLARLRLDSWAEFSARLPDDQVPSGGFTPRAAAGRPGEPPPSVEGGEQRCFRHLLVCTDDLKASKLQLHAYGQFIARHYNAPGLVQAQRAQQPPEHLAARSASAAAGRRRQQGERLPPPVSLLRQLGRGGAAGPGQEVELRVVFQRRNRDAQARQVLNAAELLERCNAWRYTAPSGAAVRALCWEVETPDLRSGLAAAHQADVLVGPHGANLANAFFMRPGSSAIELTPHGFEQHWPHRYFQKANSRDPDSQLQFWKVVLCDPQSFTPSPQEAAILATGVDRFNKTLDRFAIQRNLVVRWEALQTALEAAVDTGGDMAAYRRRVEEGTWWWITSAQDVVPATKRNCGTCKWNVCHKAVASGAISLPEGALPPLAEPKTEIGKRFHLNTGLPYLKHKEPWWTSDTEDSQEREEGRQQGQQGDEGGAAATSKRSSGLAGSAGGDAQAAAGGAEAEIERGERRPAKPDAAAAGAGQPRAAASGDTGGARAEAATSAGAAGDGGAPDAADEEEEPPAAEE